PPSFLFLPSVVFLFWKIVKQHCLLFPLPWSNKEFDEVSFITWISALNCPMCSSCQAITSNQPLQSPSLRFRLSVFPDVELLRCISVPIPSAAALWFEFVSCFHFEFSLLPDQISQLCVQFLGVGSLTTAFLFASGKGGQFITATKYLFLFKLVCKSLP